MGIIKAWQQISPKLTMKGFKKCCISIAVDGTDVDMLCNDSEEDGNVRSECEEEEGTDCEDGASDTNWQKQIGSAMLCVFTVGN
jgi:hypothetical protein